MTNKQRFNRKLIAILIFLFGMLIIFTSCNKKICPTYYSNHKAKELKKRSAFDAWNSDFCKVKKKKHKSTH